MHGGQCLQAGLPAGAEEGVEFWYAQLRLVFSCVDRQGR